MEITIFGQSAGAGSVCMHLVAPHSRGLFHRAISQSGGCTSRRSRDRDALNEQIEQYASDRGCEGDDALECLREKPVSELINLEPIDRTEGIDTLLRSFSFGAIVDGESGFLPEPAIDLFEKGEVAKVPYILGAYSEESLLYNIATDLPETPEEYEAEIRETYGDYANRVLELYPLSKYDDNARMAMVHISTDSGGLCGTINTARDAAKAGLSVYVYNYNVPWSILPEVFRITKVHQQSGHFTNRMKRTTTFDFSSTRITKCSNHSGKKSASSGGSMRRSNQP